MSALTERLIAEARSWCGTPYRHQASCKGAGADCLGLLRGVYAALYGHLPEAAPPYAAFGMAGEHEVLLDAARRYLLPCAEAQNERQDDIAPGQVLLFRMRHNLPMRHVGIATGATHMVHALTGVGVCEVPLTRWWLRHCAARFSFPPIALSPPESVTEFIDE